MLSSSSLEEDVDGSEFILEDAIKAKKAVAAASSMPSLTLSFSGSEVKERFDEAVNAIGNLMVQYQDVIEQYKDYESSLKRIKTGFFNFCEDSGVSVADNLEEEAAAAIRADKIKPTKAGTRSRLNAQDKSGMLLDVIEQLREEKGKVPADNYVEFSEIKRLFIKLAKREQKTVRMQNWEYFSVPAFGSSSGDIIEEDDVIQRKLEKSDEKGNQVALKSHRNWINISTVETRLRSACNESQKNGYDVKTTTRTVKGAQVVTRKKK